MQGELSTPHQRVIIGSLWSTWRLRAQRKQLSLHPTLDCLSQQTPFPSPLPGVLLQVPSTSQLTMVHRTKEREMAIQSVIARDAFLSTPAFIFVWMRKGVLSRFCPLVFGAGLSFFFSVSPCDRCYIWVELLGHLFCLSFSNFFFFKSKQRTFFDPWLFQFI